jgi:two-component system response regulator YesN
MKKVLIVDDEFLVRLGLKTTIDWTAHGYMIVGEASNGKEALEIFDETNPDILITDIKMPVMDGMELIKKVKKLKKNIQVVILSNYAEFSFARQAVELGVFQYMLKSEITSENLIELLKNLNVERHTEGQEKEFAQVQKENYIKSQLLSFPFGDKNPETSLEPPMEGIFPKATYVIMVLYADISSLKSSATDMMNKAICALIDSTYDNPAYCTKIYKQQIFFTVIAQAKGEEEKLYPKLIEQCGILARNARHYFDVSLQGGISLVGSPEQFPQMMKQAEIARENCFFEKENFCVYYDKPKENSVLIPHVSHKKINQLFQNKDKEGIIEYINAIFERLQAVRQFQGIKNIFIDFLAIAKALCEGLGEKYPQSLEEVKFDYDNLAQLPTLQSVRGYIIELYKTVFELDSNQGVRGYSSTVKNCIFYIEENFASNISLDDAAKAVNVSKSYLSMLFKQETGTNFVAYLNEYRIRQAKILLGKTNLKIYEVAEKVGFCSPYYFSKIFKEQTGLNCKEYKDKYFEK